MTAITEVLRDNDRLAAVLNSRLLHCRGSATFDGIADLACALLDVPVCCVSVIDSAMQVFKNQAHLPPLPANCGGVRIEDTICQHVVARGAAVIIGDTSRHLLTRYNPDVRRNGTAAYLGLPLMSEGQVIGTICVADAKPRDWTEDEIEIVEHLAHFAMFEMKAQRRGLGSIASLLLLRSRKN